MKKLLPFLAVAAACGACIAVPLLLPLLAGLAATGAGAALLGWQTGLAMLAGVVVLVAVLWARRAQLGKPAGCCAAGPSTSPGSR